MGQPGLLTRWLAGYRFAALARTLQRHEQRNDSKAVLSTLNAMAELRTRHFGAADPVAVATLNRLGLVHKALGDMAEAERCYARALVAVRSQPNVDESILATVQNNLGMAAMSRAPLDTALENLRAAVAARERLLGPSDEKTRASLFALLEVEARMGLYGAAAETLARVVRAASAAAATNAEALSATALRLADQFKTDRDWPAAIGLYALGAYIIYSNDLQIAPLGAHPVVSGSFAGTAAAVADSLEWDGEADVSLQLLTRLCDVAQDRAPAFEAKRLAARYDEARAARCLQSLDVDKLEPMRERDRPPHSASSGNT